MSLLSSAMRLIAAVWLYFSCFNLQLEFVSRRELWDDLLLGRNLIVFVRYYRWSVKTDAATLCCMCVCAGTCKGTLFLYWGKHMHIGKSTTTTFMTNGSGMEQAVEHRERRTKQKWVAGLFSCSKQINQSYFTACTRRCDGHRLLFHGHFVCLCAITPACISKAAQGQFKMKLISIKPFQIRRADGKRTAFKRPWCIPRLTDQHGYLFSGDAT